MKIPIISEQTEIDFANIPEYRSDTTHRSSATSCSDTTETQRVNKWRQETKDTIRFDVKKGTKSVLLNEANKRGISLTQMIKDALELYLSTN